MAQTIISDALTPELINQLAQVLSQLASPDNSVRSAAEQQLNQQLLGQPDLLLSALAHVTRQHSDQHVSGTCEWDGCGDRCCNYG